MCLVYTSIWQYITGMPKSWSKPWFFTFKYVVSCTEHWICMHQYSGISELLYYCTHERKQYYPISRYILVYSLPDILCMVYQRFQLHSNRQTGREQRHALCVGDEAGFEPRTSGTEAGVLTTALLAQVNGILLFCIFAYCLYFTTLYAYYFTYYFAYYSYYDPTQEACLCYS